MTNSAWAEGFRERLGLLQTRFGFSKAEMARQCGLPARTLENYFKGHKPGVEALIALSRGLGIDIEWLLGEDTEAKNFNTDLVGEAAWNGIYAYSKEMIEVSEAGKRVVEDGKILGREPAKFAAAVEAKIVAEYIALRVEYAEPSLERATASRRARGSTTV